MFAAAGGCGLGALQAAKDQGVWGIGVDNDQAFLGRHILTSATKRVDVAVLDTIRSLTEGDFAGGGDTRFDIENGGVGYGKLSTKAPERMALMGQLDKIADSISSGELVPPRDWPPRANSRRCRRVSRIGVGHHLARVRLGVAGRCGFCLLGGFAAKPDEITAALSTVDERLRAR